LFALYHVTHIQQLAVINIVQQFKSCLPCYYYISVSMVSFCIVRLNGCIIFCGAGCSFAVPIHISIRFIVVSAAANPIKGNCKRWSQKFLITGSYRLQVTAVARPWGCWKPVSVLQCIIKFKLADIL
jgi:hypothetical protein